MLNGRQILVFWRHFFNTNLNVVFLLFWPQLRPTEPNWRLRFIKKIRIRRKSTQWISWWPRQEFNHWNRQSREVVLSPSLEISKTRLDKAPNKCLWERMWATVLPWRALISEHVFVLWILHTNSWVWNFYMFIYIENNIDQRCFL